MPGHEHLHSGLKLSEGLSGFEFVKQERSKSGIFLMALCGSFECNIIIKTIRIITNLFLKQNQTSSEGETGGKSHIRFICEFLLMQKLM